MQKASGASRDEAQWLSSHVRLFAMLQRNRSTICPPLTAATRCAASLMRHGIERHLRSRSSPHGQLRTGSTAARHSCSLLFTLNDTVSGTYRNTVGTMSYMYVLWTVASAHKCEAPALWFDRLCVWTLGACL